MVKRNEFRQLEYKDIEFGEQGVLQTSLDPMHGKIGSTGVFNCRLTTNR